MSDNRKRSALVTGATSGLGFETAVHLADDGYTSVTISGRTAERAETAKAALTARTGRDVFATIVMDLAEPASVRRASAELAQRGQALDVVVLNAGMVGGPELEKTAQGVEITFASSLVGHHQFTMDLLEGDLLAADARIVIAGSEAARDDVPSFTVVDLPEFADAHFGGDMEAAAVAVIRHEGPVVYKAHNTYANAKLFVAHWAAALSRRLPDGMAVNAVSPGSAPGTEAARRAGAMMRTMMRLMDTLPRRFGLAASVPVAARRYLDVAAYPADVTGQFFASAPKKMTGPLHRMDHRHVVDTARQEAAWNATVLVSGGITYPSTV